MDAPNESGAAAGHTHLQPPSTNENRTQAQARTGGGLQWYCLNYIYGICNQPTTPLGVRETPEL